MFVSVFFTIPGDGTDSRFAWEKATYGRVQSYSPAWWGSQGSGDLTELTGCTHNHKEEVNGPYAQPSISTLQSLAPPPREGKGQVPLN